MDTALEISYLSGHETLWKAGNLGKAETARGALAQIRPQLSLCGLRCTFLSEFYRAVVSTIPRKGLEGASTPADSRTSLATVGAKEATTCVVR